MDATGRCMCGSVTFAASGVEPNVHACHCSICRRWSGGPGFAVSVGKVKFGGENNLSRYDTSVWAERGFCKRCGTHVYYRLKESDRYLVWMGTFDDQTPFVLTGEIYIDEKPDVYELAGDHPRLTGQEFLATLKS